MPPIPGLMESKRACDGERLGIGDTKANRNNSKNLNRISPHEKGNEKGG
jgi:hypothetical protein